MELYQIVLLIVGVLLLILIGLAYLYKKNYLKYSKLITPVLLEVLISPPKLP